MNIQNRQHATQTKRQKYKKTKRQKDDNTKQALQSPQPNTSRQTYTKTNFPDKYTHFSEDAF